MNTNTLESLEAGDNQLWNTDLAPTDESARTWIWTDISALWIGMAVSVPAYMLASGLIQQGMSWLQAMITVFLGNVIVLIPMLLIGHAGTKYGVPFPVLLRSSFGTIGARLPGMLRGLVAETRNVNIANLPYTSATRLEHARFMALENRWGSALCSNRESNAHHSHEHAEQAKIFDHQ